MAERALSPRLSELLQVVSGYLGVQWRQLRPGMRWALGASLVATLLALALPQTDEDPRPGGGHAKPLAALPAEASPSRVEPVPPSGQWRQLAVNPGAPVAPARADPFALAPVVAPVAVAAPIEVQPLPAPVQLTPGPAARYRVAGWLDAGGARRWLLSDGEHEVVAAAGLALRDGFMVREMKPDGILLQHPPTGTEIVLPVPVPVPAVPTR